jgi:hypothetical protein
LGSRNSGFLSRGKGGVERLLRVTEQARKHEGIQPKLHQGGLCTQGDEWSGSRPSTLKEDEGTVVWTLMRETSLVPDSSTHQSERRVLEPCALAGLWCCVVFKAGKKPLCIAVLSQKGTQKASVVTHIMAKYPKRKRLL